MKVTDYIVETLIRNDIKDVFGYPGGVICHLMDSATKYADKITFHINYHEQASAFSACGYAQECGKVGVAFSTSGPGATNLITGIANAYFDSIPTLFLTGQVDTYALKGSLNIRQRGFQETDIVAMVKPITKYAKRIDNPNDIVFELDKAFSIAKDGNPGPVLLDLPADVQRANINLEECESYISDEGCPVDISQIATALNRYICKAQRPCFLLGNGVKQSNSRDNIVEIIHRMKIPTVFSMPAFDTLEYDDPFNYGFIGANGHRHANFVLGKSDLIVTLGSRLDLKQVGNNRKEFVPQAQIVRVDIDEGNLEYSVHEDDICYRAELSKLALAWKETSLPEVPRQWNNICSQIKQRLTTYDDENYTTLIGTFCSALPSNVVITADVGQSEVWIAQQLHVKEGQSVHISSGHGAMGYSLPAAIGAYYASGHPVISFNGDGGIQMNLQELQFLSRENIPITVVIINNESLGMIRGFQEANFDANYTQTTKDTGYTVPSFERIAYAYGIDYLCIESPKDVEKFEFSKKAKIVEIKIQNDTKLNPNFGRNGLIQDQRPYLNRDTFDELMRL